MISCQVLHFAEIRERCGAPAERVQVRSGATLEEVWDLLMENHPSLRSAGLRPTPCRNRRIARWADEVSEGDELAFLMPVSGG